MATLDGLIRSPIFFWLWAQLLSAFWQRVQKANAKATVHIKTQTCTKPKKSCTATYSDFHNLLMLDGISLTRSIRDSETSIDFVQGPPGSRRERVNWQRVHCWNLLSNKDMHFQRTSTSQYVLWIAVHEMFYHFCTSHYMLHSPNKLRTDEVQWPTDDPAAPPVFVVLEMIVVTTLSTTVRTVNMHLMRNGMRPCCWRKWSSCCCSHVVVVVVVVVVMVVKEVVLDPCEASGDSPSKNRRCIFMTNSLHAYIILC